MATLEELPEVISLPKMENEILRAWKEMDAFKVSLKQSENRPIFSFYDGPPFATGLPHYGHFLAGTMKDMVCRYAHQTGHHVVRRFGWDCHGLPIEFEIEKSLGIKSKAEIEEMGIKDYNAACRAIVMRYAAQWEQQVTRMGRWMDFEHDYKTMQTSYMESVWWVFAELWRKGLVYRGFKVMPYSTGCTTPLSNFEANMNYKEVSDPSAYVTFPIENFSTCEKESFPISKRINLLAWTTTPWTLPSNLMLCVHPDVEYVLFEIKNPENHDSALEISNRSPQIYVAAKLLLASVLRIVFSAEVDDANIMATFPGSKLEGYRYEPLFEYFSDPKSVRWSDRGAFRVVVDTFVTQETGTGIVHCAPGFGEEDFRVAQKYGIVSVGGDSNPTQAGGKEREELTNEIPCAIQDTVIVCPVDDSGCFTDEVPDFRGVYCKDADNDILKILKRKGRLLHKGAIVHSYPFCWRSETPLLYKAVSSWFINVRALKPRLIANTLQSRWVPDFVRTKRFMNWLEEAQDWAVSRSRYWGTPLPLWVSSDGKELRCIGSIEELRSALKSKHALKNANNLDDLHREYVDQLEIPSARGNEYPPLRRVKEVFDCWFESGSMPYAQVHYPFENKKVFKNSFPADFIAEGLDQTRGWFYTLLVLSTALFDKPAFQNLIANGLVLAEDGKKMSKRLKNYPDPMKVIENHGADALRLYLINSPVVRAEPLRFRESGVKEIVREVFLPLLHAVKFFLQNVNAFWSRTCNSQNKISCSIQKFLPWETLQSSNIMDRWIKSETQSLVSFVHAEMEGYRLYSVVPELVHFLNNLTNWYVRMNRRRIKGLVSVTEQRNSLCTLFQVLWSTCRIMAPFAPFTAEIIYQKLLPLLPKANKSSMYGEEKPGMRSQLRSLWKRLTQFFTLQLLKKSEERSSIHHIMLPSWDKTQVNTDVEKSVRQMQKVVEMIRTLRDQNGVPLRNALRRAVICHPEAEVRKIIDELQSYVCSEGNLFEITTGPPDTYCVPRIEPNLATLGKRLRKKAANVATEISNLPDVMSRQLLEVGMLHLPQSGLQITLEDVKVKYELRPDSEHANKKCVIMREPRGLIICLDLTQDGNTIGVGMARIFVSHVQQIRKRRGLRIEDEIVVEYYTTSSLLKNVFRDYAHVVNGTIKVPWGPAVQGSNKAKMIGSEDLAIGDEAITISLYWPSR